MPGVREIAVLLPLCRMAEFCGFHWVQCNVADISVSGASVGEDSGGMSVRGREGSHLQSSRKRSLGVEWMEQARMSFFFVLFPVSPDHPPGCEGRRFTERCGTPKKNQDRDGKDPGKDGAAAKGWWLWKLRGEYRISHFIQQMIVFWHF